MKHVASSSHTISHLQQFEVQLQYSAWNQRKNLGNNLTQLCSAGSKKQEAEAR